jgi:hypothetical protein
MTWSIEHIFWGWIVLSGLPWLKLFVVFFAVATVSRTFTVVALVAVIFVSCGYLAVRAVVVIIAGSSALTSISVSSIIL